MRLVYLCTDRGVPVGGSKGASIHLDAILGELRRLGHDVTLLATRFEVDPESVGGVQVGFDRDIKALRRAIAVEAGSDLARELYALLTDGTILEGLERLHARGAVDGVYERHALWSVAGHQFCRRHGIPLVLEANAPLVDEQAAYRGLRLESVARQIERLRLAAADTVVVPSEELERWVLQLGRRGEIETLVNGVDLDLFSAPPAPQDRRALGLERRFVIAFVASLKEWHGVAELLAAFDELVEDTPEAHLLVIGDGPLGELVAAAVDRWGPQRATWLGAIPHREVPRWLALAEVGVAPYPELSDFYFSPLKVVEYLAAGLPVVASDIGQLRQLIDADVGRLVPPGCAGELAAALRDLHQRPLLRRRLSKTARARAVGRHGWDHVARRVEKCFLRLQGVPRIGDVRMPAGGVP